MTIKIDNNTVTEAVLLDGALAAIMEIPPLKSYPANNWPEHDGLEVDLSNPVFKNHEFDLNFKLQSESSLNTFMDRLKTGAHHEFSFTAWGIIKSLRYIECDYMTYPIVMIRIKVSDDNPGIPTKIPTAIAGESPVEFDGINLSDYGIKIIDNYNSEITKPAPAKQRLNVDIETRNGIEYDNQNVIIKSEAKEIDLRFLIHHANYYENYCSFMKMLTSGKRTLTYGSVDYSVVYQGMNIEEIQYANTTWLKFNVKLLQI